MEAFLHVQLGYAEGQPVPLCLRHRLTGIPQAMVVELHTWRLSWPFTGILGTQDGLLFPPSAYPSVIVPREDPRLSPHGGSVLGILSGPLIGTSFPLSPLPQHLPQALCKPSSPNLPVHLWAFAHALHTCAQRKSCPSHLLGHTQWQRRLGKPNSFHGNLLFLIAVFSTHTYTHVYTHTHT